jgi:hypothetical protein
MKQEPDPAADDPEIAGLLAFPPVVRKNIRTDGWTPAHQRGFVAWLAILGNVDKAAQAVGRTLSGAWTVRRSAGAEGFALAWDDALALFQARRRDDKAAQLGAPPAGVRHTPRHAREVREAKTFRKAAGFRARARAARARGERVLFGSEYDPAEDELQDAEKAELLDEILKRYLVKLQAERTARLHGRIVEADFYVRQLTFIELVLDVGGRTQELLAMMSQADLHILQVSATPGSTLLEKLRRSWWQEKGEADRPPPAPLGRHNLLFSTGRDDYDPARDGDRKAWERRQEEKRRLAAEAQAEWEARARGEADNDNDDPDPAA